MRIKIKLFGHLRSIFGIDATVIDLPDKSTLDDLFAELGRLHGHDAQKELRPRESAQFPLMIVVGNKDHRFLDGMQTVLHDEITVYFMPPAVGG